MEGWVEISRKHSWACCLWQKPEPFYYIAKHLWDTDSWVALVHPQLNVVNGIKQGYRDGWTSCTWPQCQESSTSQKAPVPSCACKLIIKMSFAAKWVSLDKAKCKVNHKGLCEATAERCWILVMPCPMCFTKRKERSHILLKKISCDTLLDITGKQCSTLKKQNTYRNRTFCFRKAWWELTLCKVLSRSSVIHGCHSYETHPHNVKRQHLQIMSISQV